MDAPIIALLGVGTFGVCLVGFAVGWNKALASKERKETKKKEQEEEEFARRLVLRRLANWKEEVESRLYDLETSVKSRKHETGR